MISSCHFDNWGTYGNITPWNWVGLILEVIFWVGFAVGIFLLIRAVVRNNQASTTTVSGSSAEDILQVRYAHGEITREQYELMRRDLG